MADNREIVRVTYKDLEKIAQRSKLDLKDTVKEDMITTGSKDEHGQSRKTKRPERTIYRPGMSRLKKTTEAQAEGGNVSGNVKSSASGTISPVDQDFEQLTLNSEGSSIASVDRKSPLTNKPRKKRPEIQRYVPKARMMEKENDMTEPIPQIEDYNFEDAEETLDRNSPRTPTLQAQERKVNLVKTQDKKMSITVVNSDVQGADTGFLQTMVFERSGSPQSVSNSPRGDGLDKNTPTLLDKLNEKEDFKVVKKDLDSKGERLELDKTASVEDVGRGRKGVHDSVRKPPHPGQNSPSGKSKRYSQVKRKQRNGNRANGISSSKEDLTSFIESAGTNSEVESDNMGDDIEKLAPMVFDWNEEVEKELGEEDAENNKPSEIDIPIEREELSQQRRQRETDDSCSKKKPSRSRRKDNKDSTYEERSQSKKTHDTVGREVTKGFSNRRSSFDGSSHPTRERKESSHVESDADGDVLDRRKKRGPRKRERKRTRSGPGPSSRKDGMGLSVTVGQNERQVKVNEERRILQRDRDYHSSREHLSSDSEFSRSPKGGGIIHLTHGSDTKPRKTDNHNHRRLGPQHRSHEHIPRGDNHNGGRMSAREGIRGSGSGGQRTLFDPSNPSKPIVIQSSSPKLNFTDSQHSPGDHNHAQYDPYNQPPFPPQFYQGYGRGFPPPPGPQYGMNYPTGENMYYGYSGAFQESSMCGDDTYAKDPYYHSGYDPDYVIGGMSRSQCRAMADHVLREAAPLDGQLTHLLSRRLHHDSEGPLKKLRHELMLKYEQVVLLDPDLANKHNIEQLLWKNVFYHVIEIYRRHAGEMDQENRDLLHILDEATMFYETLLQKLQRTYNFRLDQFIDATHVAPENISRAVKLALLGSQRTMICLGDIARYREQAHGKMNYGKARSWYMKAQQIAPKNGRPYNQLAILALYTKRKLDAVYYYMRSLAASNPFLTARESLMSLFDEARKKVEATEAKKQEEREKLRSWRKRRQKEGPRIEIWVSADGRSESGEVNENYEEDLTQMTPVELNKRLCLSFLNSHGKLFTKIGMETFEDVSSQLLQEYQAVLGRKPGIIANNRLLQLMAINMFAVDNTAFKGSQLDNNCRSLLQEHAVEQGLDMFAVLLSRFSNLLSTHLESKDYPGKLFTEDIRELVPSIKVWSDWMLCHLDLWNPAPNLRDPENSFSVDVWKECAEMLNVLTEVDIAHVKLYTDKKEGCDAIMLEEDVSLAGFVPLLSAPSQPTFVHATVDKLIAKDCLRIQKLHTFGEYLCGIEPPMLAYNVESRKYYSVAPSVDYSSDESKGKGTNSEIEDVVIESELSEDGSDEEHGGEGHLQELRAKKEQLQQKLLNQTKRKQNVEAILEKQRHRAIELQICPVFLVPDTNCFINYMSGMRKLLHSKKFSIIVPLVVINELDGLSLGGSRGHPHDVAHQQHMTKVSNHAKQAVQLLESEFGKRNPHLKALTSKGSTLETISFRSEESDSTGINDDLILSCCLHYCKDRAKDFMPKDKEKPIRLLRDVVLLTDDRNLRLKAHTRNVPVKDVPSFLKWANIT